MFVTNLAGVLLYANVLLETSLYVGKQLFQEISVSLSLSQARPDIKTTFLP